VASLDVQLRALTLDSLHSVLAHLVASEDPELRFAKQAILARYDGSSDWWEEAVRFLMMAVARTGAAYAIPALTLKAGGFPFLKKSPLRLDADGAAATIAVLRTLSYSSDGILAEAEESLEIQSLPITNIGRRSIDRIAASGS
jgi:hypothetical protein